MKSKLSLIFAILLLCFSIVTTDIKAEHVYQAKDDLPPYIGKSIINILNI